MSSAIVPIRQSSHASKAWRPNQDFGFAASSAVVPIAGDEVARVATEYALAFLDGEVPQLVALLGLRPDQSLYVGPAGRWLGDYVPAIFRGFPFKLMATDGDQFALGYDEASGLLVTPGEGEPFFTSDGEPAERIQQILRFLVALNRGIEGTKAAAQSLKQAGLLETWPLKLQGDGTDQNINGLLRVNEAALADLDAQAFANLRGGGALALAYAQLISMVNISKLGRLAQAHVQHALATEKQRENVKSMFSGDVEDEQIDWDAVLKTN